MGWFERFRRPAERRAAEELYRAIVAQARSPVFYADWGVPDTPDGRYDMIMAHAAMVMRRLHRSPEETRALSQALFDLMFADMDQNLREMGVGDLAVGKRVKAMAKAFYGRLVAYDTALSSRAPTELIQPLRRNVYRKSEPRPNQVAALADYLRAEAQRLDAMPLPTLVAGTLQFSSPPATAGATATPASDVASGS